MAQSLWLFGSRLNIRFFDFKRLQIILAQLQLILAEAQL